MDKDVPVVTKLEPALTPRNKVGNHTATIMQVSMRTHSSCVMSLVDGKNIQYFHDESTDQIMAELWSMSTKIVVDPDVPCPCSRIEELVIAKFVTPGKGEVGPTRNIDRWRNPKTCNITGPPKAVNNATLPTPPPFASFETVPPFIL